MRSAAGRLVCWLLCCSLLAGISPVSLGQETTAPPTSLTSRFATLKDNLLRLEQAWREQTISRQQAEQTSKELRQELKLLKDELSEVRTSLASSERNYDLSQQEVQRLTLLLEQSEETLRQLQQSFRDDQRRARRQIILGWFAGTGLGLVLGLIIGKTF